MIYFGLVLEGAAGKVGTSTTKEFKEDWFWAGFTSGLFEIISEFSFKPIIFYASWFISWWPNYVLLICGFSI